MEELFCTICMTTTQCQRTVNFSELVSTTQIIITKITVQWHRHQHATLKETEMPES